MAPWVLGYEEEGLLATHLHPVPGSAAAVGPGPGRVSTQGLQELSLGFLLGAGPRPPPSWHGPGWRAGRRCSRGISRHGW